MDALYPRLAHAVLGSQLSAPGLFDGLSAVNPMLDAPRAQGSAYDGGWEGYVQRAMNVSLGTALDPNAVDWCGDSAACAATVKGALDAAISDLSATYGTGDPAAWTCSTANPAPSGSSAAPGSGQQTRTPCNPVYDDIEFNAVGVGTVPGIPWINRPTFQQVVQYQDHR
jgi:hypothetical protein